MMTHAIFGRYLTCASSLRMMSTIAPTISAMTRSENRNGMRSG